MSAYEDYREILNNKDIPLLVLDHRWHQLFDYLEMTPKIEWLTNELNGLLKEQGKWTSKRKDVHNLKRKLMKDIVNLADDMEKRPNKKQDKEMDDLRRVLLECGDKINECENSLKNIPDKIEKLNEELMLATMELCYTAFQENTEEIEVLVDAITRMRVELKKDEVRKAEVLEANERLYIYLHHIFGPRVMEMFDLKYNPRDKKLTEKGKQEEWIT